MKHNNLYTTRDIVIPKGTKFLDWNGTRNGVIGVTKDSVIYLSMCSEDVKYSEGLLSEVKPEEVGG